MKDIVLHLRLPLHTSFAGVVELEHLAELEDYVFDAADKWLLEHPQYPCSCLLSDKTEVITNRTRVKYCPDGN